MEKGSTSSHARRGKIFYIEGRKGGHSDRKHVYFPPLGTPLAQKKEKDEGWGSAG